VSLSDTLKKMPAVSFREGAFYVCRWGVSIPPADLESDTFVTGIESGDYVCCQAIVRRSGGKGRGLYAKLKVYRGQDRFIAFHRVSKNHIGAGAWKELELLTIVALAYVGTFD